MVSPPPLAPLKLASLTKRPKKSETTEIHQAEAKENIYSLSNSNRPLSKIETTSEIEIPSKNIQENVLHNQPRDVKDIPLREILCRIEKKIDRISKQLIKEKLNHFEDFSFVENFPICSEEHLVALEKKIDDKQFCSFLINLLRKNIPESENRFVSNFKNIIDAKLLIDYNWEGRKNKKALNTYKLFYKCLKEATNLNNDKFVSLVREGIRVSHRLFYVKKSQLKIKNKSNFAR